MISTNNAPTSIQVPTRQTRQSEESTEQNPTSNEGGLRWSLARVVQSVRRWVREAFSCFTCCWGSSARMGSRSNSREALVSERGEATSSSGDDRFRATGAPTSTSSKPQVATAPTATELDIFSNNVRKAWEKLLAYLKGYGAPNLKGEHDPEGTTLDNSLKMYKCIKDDFNRSNLDITKHPNVYFIEKVLKKDDNKFVYQNAFNIAIKQRAIDLLQQYSADKKGADKKGADKKGADCLKEIACWGGAAEKGAMFQKADLQLKQELDDGKKKSPEETKNIMEKIAFEYIIVPQMKDHLLPDLQKMPFYSEGAGKTNYNHLKYHIDHQYSQATGKPEGSFINLLSEDLKEIALKP